MREGARVAAAIEILSDIEARKRPAADAVKDWMLSHRFAGSKDRAAIGDLVFCALRWRQSSAWRMGEDDARAVVLGALVFGLGLAPEAVSESFVDDPHAPGPVTDQERQAFASSTLDAAPAWIAGDYPEWIDASLARAFGDRRAEEGAALAAPAPLDLRANTLKTTREKLLASLAESPRLRREAAAAPFAPEGVRIPWIAGGAFPFATEQSFVKGWFEVQDEGSQIAAALAAAKPGLQVADLCAGGGGKTLALAAAMQNKGQIYAFDVDGRRLAPLHDRIERAGVRNVQIRAPMKTRDALEDLRGRMDLALVDAPCTGSGTWRRAPDTKWRLKPQALELRRAAQAEALDIAAPLVRPGGRLHYVTCSVLPEENEEAVAAFLGRHPDFAPAELQAPTREIAELLERNRSALARHAVQLTPLRAGCDGFFVAGLVRKS